MAALTSILLVDDDKDDQLLFTDAVNEIDPAIICAIAGNGLEALRLLEEKSPWLPSVVFLDLNMPHMGGMECLAAIKNVPDWTSIPVVIFTTSNNIADREKSLALGASDFITKPPSFEALKHEISRIIQ